MFHNRTQAWTLLFCSFILAGFALMISGNLPLGVTFFALGATGLIIRNIIEASEDAPKEHIDEPYALDRWHP